VIPPAELGELEAFRSLLAAQEQAEIGGALCTSFEATPGSALFNRALRLGLAEPATEAALDRIDDFFSGRGLAYGIPADSRRATARASGVARSARLSPRLRLDEVRPRVGTGAATGDRPPR
jgi:hypothetical protein